MKSGDWLRSRLRPGGRSWSCDSSVPLLVSNKLFEHEPERQKGGRMGTWESDSLHLMCGKYSGILNLLNLTKLLNLRHRLKNLKAPLAYFKVTVIVGARTNPLISILTSEKEKKKHCSLYVTPWNNVQCRRLNVLFMQQWRLYLYSCMLFRAVE